MSYTTKKYTRPVLTTNVKRLSASNFVNVNTFANALSPRAGRKSAQFAALRNVVGNKNLATAFAIENASANKKYLLSLLKNA